MSLYELSRVKHWRIFLAEHPCLEVEDLVTVVQQYINIKPWVLTFDGSKNFRGAGAGLMIISPGGQKGCFTYELDPNCTNNQAKYEALIIGLRILVSMDVQSVQIMGDSQLVIRQLTGEYRCCNTKLLQLFEEAKRLLQ